jgi:hypothetical protein
MSYNKLGFTSGQTLKAEHLNHMEDGIANISWNDLTDKPFYEESMAPIIWDGNTEGKEAMDGLAYLVYDKPIEAKALIGATITVSADGEVVLQQVLYEKDIVDLSASNGFPKDSALMLAIDGVLTKPLAMIVNNQDTGYNIGVYFVNMNGEYVSSLEFPTIYKTIDENYIPDTFVKKDEAYTKDNTPNFLNIVTEGGTVLWDGNTDKIDDYFYLGNFTFFKVSDIIYNADELVGGTFERITKKVSGEINGNPIHPITPYNIDVYPGCVRGVSFVSAKAGTYTLTSSQGGTDTQEVTIPSDGTYFHYSGNSLYKSWNASIICGKDVRRARGLIVHSSTEGSNKQFKITVDDNGIISATEVIA